MRVTEVEIAHVLGGGSLIALASVVLDDRLYLSGIAVYRKLIGSGIRLAYPARVVAGRRHCLFHPVESSIGQEIESAISSKLAATLGEGDD